jgi:hypothetical protein
LLGGSLLCQPGFQDHPRAARRGAISFR